jgi:hypothetical protein
MKRAYIIIVLVLAFRNNGTAQNQLSRDGELIFKQISHEFYIKDTIKAGILLNADETTSRIPNYLGNSAFDSIFKPIFGKVMLGNNDLINQGSAYALSVSQFDSKFNLNYNWARDKKDSKKGFLNAGFAATSSTKFLQIFASKQWQQGFSFSFGFTKPQKQKLAYSLDPNDYINRRHNSVILYLKEAYNLIVKDTTAINDKLKEVQNLKLESALLANFSDSIKDLKLKSNKELLESKEELNSVRKMSLLKNDPVAVARYVDSCLAEFQVKYFKDIAYSFWWYNFNIRPEYKGIAIYDTVAAKNIGIQKKDFFRVGVDMNVNYVNNNKKGLFILQLGGGLKNTNYLEGKKPAEIEFLRTAVLPGTAIKEVEEGVLADDYSKYKKQFILFTPVAGFNYFFGKKRIFGIESFASGKIGFDSKNIDFKSLFTFRAGPLISINGANDITKSTFGIIAQWEDVPFKKPSISDGFTLSVRIGVPFNY